MKKLIFTLTLFLSTQFFAQDYRIAHKLISDKSVKLKYEFSISFPMIKDFKDNITSMNLFNRFITNKSEGIRDTFNLWMREWDTTSNSEMESYYEAGDTVFYASNSLISVLFYENWYFSGAAHPNNSNFSINYDLENHKEVSLSDLLETGWENKISEICIREITKQKQEWGIEPSDWLSEGAGPKAENFKVFNVTKKGILITFPTYQVGPYVEGPSEVFIAYEEIKSLIKPGSTLAFVK